MKTTPLPSNIVSATFSCEPGWGLWCLVQGPSDHWCAAGVGRNEPGLLDTGFQQSHRTIQMPLSLMKRKFGVFYDFTEEPSKQPCAPCSQIVFIFSSIWWGRVRKLHWPRWTLFCSYRESEFRKPALYINANTNIYISAHVQYQSRSSSLTTVSHFIVKCPPSLGAQAAWAASLTDSDSQQEKHRLLRYSAEHFLTLHLSRTHTSLEWQQGWAQLFQCDRWRHKSTVGLALIALNDNTRTALLVMPGGRWEDTGKERTGLWVTGDMLSRKQICYRYWNLCHGLMDTCHVRAQQA